MNAFDRDAILLAVSEAQKSTAEDDRPHPKVGVAIVHDNKIIASAHRGEIPGAHAEYVALEGKLRDQVVAGCTVYTTLEPCTTRNHPKVPCAQRLVERRVGRVVIGMFDPNPVIHGRGLDVLREGGIAVQLFPDDLMNQAEELNRDFKRSFTQRSNASGPSEHFVENTRGRSLDEWYLALNAVYWNVNFHRTPELIFTHLAEVVGGISLLASGKEKSLPGEDFVPKALAWWMALSGKLRIRSLEDLLWVKFPGVCPYCKVVPHEPLDCAASKKGQGPEWKELARIAERERQNRPTSLGAWQRMFYSIYQAHLTEGYGATFARLAEELGELAEALRLFTAVPGYFLNEAADLFAWLMHIQNMIDLNKKIPKDRLGVPLEIAFCRAYPDRCLDCDSAVCRCAPILESTIGRISNEVPLSHNPADLRRVFMTPDEAVLRMQFTKRPGAT